eukprot:9424713-Alexandrium_andersonii.AAC.1
MILPAVFRTWSKALLAQMRGWIQQWMPENSYAGVRGKGAADAWHSTALDMDCARCFGHDFRQRHST